ncbi:MAG TPA: curli assembly protein CsgF [Pseudolabrys sp.]|jgi:curli production assembly/transport component CsgF|nr:curli assembly protein CsgF [Pseudolabrys sp.]
MKYLGRFILAAVAAVAFCATASATEQVYHPVNPTFGGNPFNGSFLVQTAQTQGKGAKSGNQGPDLSGLSSALSNIGNGGGSTVIIPPNP